MKLYDPGQQKKPPRKPRACKIVLSLCKADGERMVRLPRYERPKEQKRSG